MDEDDQKILNDVKTTFWARLDYLQDLAKKTDAVPDLVTRRAKKVSHQDATVADWMIETHQPDKVRQKLENIRFKAKNGSFYEAWRDLDRLEQAGQRVWQLASFPMMMSGRAQVRAGERGNEMRSSASFAATHAIEAQAMADEIAAKNPNLSWTAIRKTVAARFKVSPETVKKSLRNPKKAG